MVGVLLMVYMYSSQMLLPQKQLMFDKDLYWIICLCLTKDSCLINGLSLIKSTNIIYQVLICYKGLMFEKLMMLGNVDVNKWP